MKWYSVLAVLMQSIIWIVVLLCMLASRYNCWCLGSRRRTTQPLGQGGVVVGIGGRTRGLDPTEIERYPKFSYSKVEDHEGAKMSRDITECVVCLGAFMQGETLRLIPKCGHVFHSDCVDVWLRSHATCPCCRDNLLVPPAETTTDQLPV